MFCNKGAWNVGTTHIPDFFYPLLHTCTSSVSNSLDDLLHISCTYIDAMIASFCVIINIFNNPKMNDNPKSNPNVDVLKVKLFQRMSNFET